MIDSDPTSSTYNTQIATIALPGATDVAFSPDSRRAYILMNDGKTVRVVDTATSAVVGYFTVPGANSIAVAPNGTVYPNQRRGGDRLRRHGGWHDVAALSSRDRRVGTALPPSPG